MTTIECQANLADAQLKYHQLVTGQMTRVIVDQNGDRVEFSAANATTLLAYIQKLNSICGVPSGPQAIDQPARFSF